MSVLSASSIISLTFTESNFLSLVNINDNVLSPKNLMPSKHSYLIQVTKPVSPPVNVSINILYGQGIKLLYILNLKIMDENKLEQLKNKSVKNSAGQIIGHIKIVI